MKSICVFCGSATGARVQYIEAARQMGRLLAEQGVELVYGGARVGLMGAMADASLKSGGRVFGVLPESLAAVEIAHAGITELRIVSSMHERKAAMAERADAFVALPGGYGTLDEIFEMLSWIQVGIHRKPCALLNVEGFFDKLLAYLDHAATEGLLRAEHRSLLIVETDPHTLFRRLCEYQHPRSLRRPREIVSAELDAQSTNDE